jgi:AcrR family transcriptional regulator
MLLVRHRGRGGRPLLRTKGTLFAYFPSKEEIVFADTAPLRERLCHELRHRSNGLSAVDTLRAFLVDHMITPGLREALRERLIAENEQLRVHYRGLAEVEDALAEAITVDLGEPADGPRPRFAAAAALSAIAIAEAQARSGHGATASRTQAVAVLDQAAAFLEGGLAAIGPTPARRRTA